MSIRVYSLKKTPTSPFTPDLLIRYSLTGSLVRIDPSACIIEDFCSKSRQIENSRCKSKPSPNNVYILMYPSMSKLARCCVGARGWALLRPGKGYQCWSWPVSSPAERWSRDSKLVLHCREQRSPDSHNTTTTTTTLHLYSTSLRKIQQLFTWDYKCNNIVITHYIFI